MNSQILTERRMREELVDYKQKSNKMKILVDKHSTVIRFQVMNEHPYSYTYILSIFLKAKKRSVKFIKQ